MGLRIVLAADGAAVEYRDRIKADLEKDERVDEIIDVGVTADEDIDYPHVAVKGARIIAAGQADRGIFFCGTGIGMAIAANKVPGIRACTAHDSFSTERLIKSNNAQVICFGQRVVGIELVRQLVGQWLGYEFDPESASARKVAAISSYEGDLGEKDLAGLPACGA